MTNEQALEVIRKNLSAAINDAYGLNSEYECEQFRALSMAFKALKKQIPMKTKRDCTEVAPCPVCGFSVIEKVENFCPHCGQMIDWSGMNE